MKLTFKGKGVAEKYRKLARQLPGVVNEALYDVAVDMRYDFEKTVATWKDKPSFEIIQMGRGYTVQTDDEKYLWVDQGTRAHAIEAAPLVFQANYVAKTQPRVIGSRPGGKSGPTVFVMGIVQHPGT